MYLDRVQHSTRLLQRNCIPCLKCLCTMGHFQEPFAQLVHHFSIPLPLADETINDPTPLLSTSHYALPLVTQQSQLQIELISVGDFRKTGDKERLAVEYGGKQRSTE